MSDNLTEPDYDRASLLFNCSDQVGITASMAKFFSDRYLNITRREEFTDHGQVFSRLEWSLDDRWENQQEFAGEFSKLASTLGATFEARFFNRPQTVGLFVSTQAHALMAMLNKQEANFFPNIEISFIIGNDQSMHGIADRHATPFFYIPTDSAVNALEYEQRQLDIIHRYRPDYLGLARYMTVLSANFLQRVKCPVVNIQSSFIPSITGTNPYQTAYNRGVKLIGASAHFVTAEFDQGPIIEQDVHRLGARASLDEMIKIGRDIEQKVFVRAMLKVLEHKIIVYKNRTIVFN